MAENQPEPTNPWLKLQLRYDDVETITEDDIRKRMRSMRERYLAPAQFFAAILEAEGLTARAIYPDPGDDRDIFARDGPFGTGPNRWFCRVLDEEEPDGEAAVRQFLGDLPAGHQGIIVALGSLDRSARKLAAEHDVRTVHSREFMTLLVSHYASLSDDLQRAIPLRSVMAPAWD